MMGNPHLKTDVTEADIIAALHQWYDGRERWRSVSHCKLGPSFGADANLRIMDFLAIYGTWNHPLRIEGVEIKVSRKDFTADKKYVDYLPACTHFYWACPYGIIQPSDLKHGAGLMYYDMGTRCMHVVKKAKRRPIDETALDSPLGRVLYYLAMWRLFDANGLKARFSKVDARNSALTGTIETVMSDLRKALAEARKGSGGD